MIDKSELDDISPMTAAPIGSYDDLLRISKRWYTEQRGRVVGNTTDWDQLSELEHSQIVDSVFVTLSTMEEKWQYNRTNTEEI